MTIERSEPAYSNDEVGMLRSFLDHYRATIRLQASGLTDAQLDQALPPSDLTLGGMLKHLAFVEDYWFSYNLTGHEPSPPWDAAPWDDDGDWDWHSAAGASHAELDALLAGAIARSEECLDATLAADPDLDRPVARTAPFTYGPGAIRYRTRPRRTRLTMASSTTAPSSDTRNEVRFNGALLMDPPWMMSPPRNAPTMPTMMLRKMPCCASVRMTMLASQPMMPPTISATMRPN